MESHGSWRLLLRAPRERCYGSSILCIFIAGMAVAPFFSAATLSMPTRPPAKVPELTCQPTPVVSRCLLIATKSKDIIMTGAVAGLRAKFPGALSQIAARTDSKTRCIILSGGVDTCAILAASKELGVTYGAAFTVLCGGDDSPDRTFATAAAAEHSLPHHIIEVKPDDLLGTYLPKCVKLLNTFDGMTLRNSLVVAAAMRKAGELGFKDCIVGDGADELFGGYSFCWGHADDPALWKEKRDSMCKKWTFATAQLAAAHGLKSHSPYTEPEFVEWALANTGREDCIGVRKIRLVQMRHLSARSGLHRPFGLLTLGPVVAGAQWRGRRARDRQDCVERSVRPSEALRCRLLDLTVG